MSKEEFEDVEDIPVKPAAPLKEAISLKDLMKGKQLEFTLDGEREIFPEEEADLSERNVESTFSFDEWESQINLDVLSTDEEGLKTPFEKMRENMTPVTSDEGVMKEVLVQGTGEVVPPDAAVYVHYNSYHEMEEIPFDTTYLRCSKPVRIQLGYGSTIMGFELAVKTMKKKEKSRFLVEPQYAYGKMGIPPRIKGNATILIVIELIHFVDSGGAKELKEKERELTNDIKKFEVAHKRALSFVSLAKDYFLNNNIKAAIENYRKAESLLQGCILSNGEDQEASNNLLIKIYTNLAVCYNHGKVNTPQKACSVVREAFRINSKYCGKNSKLLFQWGKSLSTLGEYKKANDKLLLARQLNPEDPNINKAIHDLKEKERKAKEDEKITYKKAFGFTGKNDQTKEKATPPKIDNQKLSEFEKTMRTQVCNFVHRNVSRIQLPHGISEEEKEICRKIANEFGIHFEERLYTVDGRNTKVHAFSK